MQNGSDFTHFNDEGRARMVDVGEKPPTRRTAVAGARVLVSRETFDLIRSGGMKKGDVLTVAQIAGVMGAKRTPDLIPMCHPILIDGIDLSLSLNENDLAVEIRASVSCGPSALQNRRRSRRFYEGGRDMNYTAAVITVSDKGFRGEREDTSGPAICSIVERCGLEVVYRSIVPDEQEDICRELIRCADEKKVALVLTTGGTGFSPRDITPEATKAVIERETPGIPEAMRAESMKITPRGCLSRSAAGIRGGTLIVNLPGSEKAAKENLLAVMDGLVHGLDMLASSGSANCAEEGKK